jgi:hypothetical protein
MANETKLPTAPGSVIQSDSLLIRTRFDNWVSDGCFVVADKDLEGEPFTIIFDAADADGPLLTPEEEVMRDEYSIVGMVSHTHLLVSDEVARDIAGHGKRKVYRREVSPWQHIPGTGGDTNE